MGLRFDVRAKARVTVLVVSTLLVTISRRLDR